MRKFILWQKPSLILAVAFSTMFIIVLSQKVNADMFGWFERTELELSPEINGTITLHGKPVAGATVQRYLSYGDKDFNDNVTTDVDGRFKFPVKKAKIRVSPMFDTWVSQLLIVEHAKQRVKIWSTGATNTLTYVSVHQLLSSLECELTSPEMKISIPRTNPQSPPLWLVNSCNFKHENIIIEKELSK